jgi:hypothetical protein
MLSSISRSGGIPGNSSGNMPGYSFTTLISSKDLLFAEFTVPCSSDEVSTLNSILFSCGLVKTTDLLRH